MWLWALLAAALVDTARAQTLYPLCDAELRTQDGDPKCEGLYPTMFRQTGGERAIMAFSNLHVPWYVKSQFDPCPWSQKEWLCE